jgi:hypothetical protein
VFFREELRGFHDNPSLLFMLLGYGELTCYWLFDDIVHVPGFSGEDTGVLN